MTSPGQRLAGVERDMFHHVAVPEDRCGHFAHVRSACGYDQQHVDFTNVLPATDTKVSTNTSV
jgi:hypothetical protein